MDGTWLKVIELGVVVKKVVKRHGRQEGRKEGSDHHLIQKNDLNEETHSINESTCPNMTCSTA